MPSAAPWLAHYDADVPATLAPYPDRTLLDYLADAARTQPGKPALLFKGATMTYGELERASDACAAAFAALGVRRGDRVGLLLPNCPQFFIAELGAWKIGAIVAPLNPIYTEHELEGPLRDHGIETHRHADALLRARQARPAAHAACAASSPPTSRSTFRRSSALLFTLLREKRDGDRITLEPGDHDFATLLLEHRGRAVGARARSRADDPAVLLMSGGTTGTPKGVARHARRATSSPACRSQAWNEAALRGADDVILLPLPLFHVYGNVGVQALALITGSADRARAESARSSRSARDDPPREAGVLQRRADALHRAAQPPGRPERQGRLQVDQDLLLRRRAAAGRNEAPLRSRSPAAASSKATR